MRCQYLDCAEEAVEDSPFCDEHGDEHGRRAPRTRAIPGGVAARAVWEAIGNLLKGLGGWRNR